MNFIPSFVDFYIDLLIFVFIALAYSTHSNPDVDVSIISIIRNA